MVTANDFLERNPLDTEGLTRSPVNAQGFTHYKIIGGELYYKTPTQFFSELGLNTTEYLCSTRAGYSQHLRNYWVKAGSYLNSMAMTPILSPPGSAGYLTSATVLNTRIGAIDQLAIWCLDSIFRTRLLQELAWAKLFYSWADSDLSSVISIQDAYNSRIASLWENPPSLLNHHENMFSSYSYIPSEYLELDAIREPEEILGDAVSRSNFNSNILIPNESNHIALEIAELTLQHAMLEGATEENLDSISNRFVYALNRL